MRTIRLSKSFLLLLSTMVFMGTLSVRAQEEETEQNAAVEDNAAETLTQGQAAVILARRLGLFAGGGEVPSQARAIQLLTARGISPKDGWEAEALLDAGDLARMLVQALGLESELSEAQIAGDDATPYIDLLIEKYNLDVTTFKTAAELNQSEAGDNGQGISSDIATTDPVRKPINPYENEDKNLTPISLRDLDRALAAVVGAGGGSSGQVNAGASNITPSAP